MEFDGVLTCDRASRSESNHRYSWSGNSHGDDDTDQAADQNEAETGRSLWVGANPLDKLLQ